MQKFRQIPTQVQIRHLRPRALVYSIPIGICRDGEGIQTTLKLKIFVCKNYIVYYCLIFINFIQQRGLVCQSTKVVKLKEIIFSSYYVFNRLILTLFFMSSFFKRTITKFFLYGLIYFNYIEYRNRQLFYFFLCFHKYRYVLSNFCTRNHTSPSFSLIKFYTYYKYKI